MRRGGWLLVRRDEEGGLGEWWSGVEERMEKRLFVRVWLWLEHPCTERL